ncbi:MAG: hypothetical protein Q8Q09_13410 [Deltaproteobacteria bacterium]|nr:hypothetical protein [Deltaproteobacteria bacterium]
MSPLRGTWLSFSLCICSGCAFDISRLMPPPADGSTEDRAVIDVVVPPSDVADAGPPQPTCVSLLDPMNGTLIGGSTIIRGNTGPAHALRDPPASCNANSRGAPEVYYDYQVRGATGAIVTAVTEVPTEGGAMCPPQFDTVVSLYRGNCQAIGELLGCNDDNTDPASCFSVGSRASTSMSLMQGDRMVVVVDGYQANSGPYTLTIAENVLSEVAPLLTPQSTVCACPATRPTVTTSVPLFEPAQMNHLFSNTAPVTGGTRSFPSGGRLVGVALELGLRRNDFATVPACRTFAATFDLSFAGTNVRAFTVDSSTDITRTRRLIYRAAGDIALPTSVVQLRMRPLPMPAAACMVEIVTGNVHVVTGA